VTTTPPPASPQQSASTSANPTTTYVTTTVTAPPPSTGEPAGPPPGGSKGPISLVDAVSEYYRIIPGNLDLGWTKLGPDMQARIGRAGYQEYWSPISNLAVVSGPAQTGANTVEVTFEYNKGGHRYRETHQLGMVVINGQPLIDTDPGVPNTQVG
jgi:eukaryotic-like serine/threonine-protein kinase